MTIFLFVHMSVKNMRKLLLSLLTALLFIPVSAIVLDDFETGESFRWYNTGAYDMGISDFGLGSHSLRINNSEEIFYVTYFYPATPPVSGTDLRFKMYHSPDDSSRYMWATCFMLYDDESSETRMVTPEVWEFNEWSEMSCNGGGTGKLLSAVIYFVNVTGVIYIDDFGYYDEPAQGGGLTGMAVVMTRYLPLLLPGILIGVVGILLVRRYTNK